MDHKSNLFGNTCSCISSTRDSVSWAIQTPGIFSTLFSVFEFSDETVSLVFDVLLHNLTANSGDQGPTAWRVHKLIKKTVNVLCFCLPLASVILFW